jgi:hypothetical protein
VVVIVIVVVTSITTPPDGRGSSHHAVEEDRTVPAESQPSSFDVEFQSRGSGDIDERWSGDMKRRSTIGDDGGDGGLHGTGRSDGDRPGPGESRGGGGFP